MEAVKSLYLPKCGSAQFKHTSTFSGCCPAAFQIKALTLPRWASVHQPPARQGSQPRQPTVDNQILNLYCRGTSHFHQVKIQRMQTRIFVRFRFYIHICPPVNGVMKLFIHHHYPACLETHICPSPATMWSVGMRKELSLLKKQGGRSWMQEKPSRNDDRLYGSIQYHSDNVKICTGGIKYGQSTTAGVFS